VLVLGFILVYKNSNLSLINSSSADTFRSYVIKLNGVQHLQLAELSQVETFERKSTHSLFWDTLQLPDVVVEMIIPVQYTYFIDLKKNFDFSLQNNILTVYAPEIQVAKPAADISAIELNIKKGSFLRNEKEILKQLRLKASELLERRGNESKLLVLETCRKQLAEVVRQWFRLQNPNYQDLEIKIIFQSSLAQSSQKTF
jgi:hypothetical protein